MEPLHQRSLPPLHRLPAVPPSVLRTGGGIPTARRRSTPRPEMVLDRSRAITLEQVRANTLTEFDPVATDTKTRILDTALALFNERGTASVTTNHIAEALGMSPGNLYYHFRNKAEIVRALFARITAAWATNYAVAPGTMPTVQIMEGMVAGNFEIQARYRFFFRDLTLLLNADPELAAAYRANRSAGIGNTTFLLSLFAEAGVLTPVGDADALDDVVQLLWLVGDFWLVFKDTGGAEFSQADMDQGVRLFRRILTPHLKGQ